jgi:Rrf2 family protein
MHRLLLRILIAAMLHYSKSAGYAIHALSCIGSADGPSLVRDISKCTGLHRPYLAKIINQLAHQGLIKAKRGYHGGVVLARPAEKISLFQVVEAVERDGPGTDCFFGLDICPAKKHCPAHQQWNKLRLQLERLLRQTKLSSVIASVASRKK